MFLFYANTTISLAARPPPDTPLSRIFGPTTQHFAPESLGGPCSAAEIPCDRTAGVIADRASACPLPELGRSSGPKPPHPLASARPKVTGTTARGYRTRATAATDAAPCPWKTVAMLNSTAFTTQHPSLEEGQGQGPALCTEPEALGLGKNRPGETGAALRLPRAPHQTLRRGDGSGSVPHGVGILSVEGLQDLARSAAAVEGAGVRDRSRRRASGTRRPPPPAAACNTCERAGPPRRTPARGRPGSSRLRRRPPSRLPGAGCCGPCR